MTIGCIGSDAATTTTGASSGNANPASDGAPYHIDVADPLDLAFWALVFEVSAAAVQRAVEQVGVQVGAVTAYLLSNATSPATTRQA